jgi:hypothetical protein
MRQWSGRPSIAGRRAAVIAAAVFATSSGCDGKPGRITPAPAMSAEEKREFEARVSAALDKERQSQREQQKQPPPTP